MPESIYSPPQTTIESNANRGHVTSGYARVDGKHLWVSKDFLGPNICMVTGKKVDESSKTKKVDFRYVTPFAYLTLLFGFLIGIIIISILQKPFNLIE